VYGVYGLGNLRVQHVNRLKSLKRVFPSQSANGAYRLYGVGKNRLEMLILFDAKKVTVECLHLKRLKLSKMLHKIPNLHVSDTRRELEILNKVMLLILPFSM